MIRTSRRAVLKGGALAGAAAALPLAARRTEARVVVYDSRVAVSQVFAGGEGIDLAQGMTAARRALAQLPRGVCVEGLTRWSDWVGLRGLLQDRGFRTEAETRAPGSPALFRWTMRGR
ncbi:MAG: hypothetical protein KGL48_04250 [Sphingomonadales bacterium]|nr:hypothetical protein [Sphingomonadales bacterium]MDE2567438.1 hypothetical protein [Sphingomonadales bacterium]